MLVDSEDRIHALDILRGLALFGMIVVHFHQRMRLEVSGPEDLIGWAVYILIEQKAWGTFAFLFGVGFAVLLRRLEARHQPVVSTYLRRLAALAVLGLIAQVGFGFTILFTYACWGLVLLVIRRWSTRALLVTAVVTAAAQPVTAMIFALRSWWTGTPLPLSVFISLGADLNAALAGLSYRDLLSARWALFVANVGDPWSILMPDSNLALFIVGLLAVRHGVIDDPGRHTRLIKQWMVFGAVCWFLSWVILPLVPGIPIPGAGWQIAYGFGVVNEQWLCFTYIGAMLLALTRWPWLTTRLRPIGQAGRMALTNYMVQVAILDALASGYGARLKLRPLLYLPAAIVLFAGIAAMSNAWLSRFRFGPLEWVWRAVTYLRMPPMKKA